MTANGNSLRTRRFHIVVLGLTALVAIGILGLLLKAEAALIIAVTAPIVTLTGGAYATGTWHDKNVRVAQTQAVANTAIATEDPKTTEAVAAAVSVGIGAAPVA